MSTQSIHVELKIDVMKRSCAFLVAHVWCKSDQTGLSRGLRVYTLINNHVYIALVYNIIVYVGQINEIRILIQIKQTEIKWDISSDCSDKQNATSYRNICTVQSVVLVPFAAHPKTKI